MSLLPEEWREIAVESGLTKGLRKDKDPAVYLHLLMLHLLCGYSLRETAACAAAMGLSDMSDVAMLKRLRKSERFLRMLCQCFLRTARHGEPREGFRLRLVDGTDIKEPGQFGTMWRVHFSFSLPQMECDELKLTKAAGAGTGEDLRQFSVARGDVLVADRGYCRPGGLFHVMENGGFFIVRVNTQTLGMLDEAGLPLNYGKMLKTLQKSFEVKEFKVMVKGAENGTAVPARLCVIRKDEASAERTRRQLAGNASKKQRKPASLSLLAAGYVILVTNLPEDVFPPEAVLECYRLRWQVELTFKRMKSLLGIGALPKYTDDSSRAWLYGKLLIAMIIERCSSLLGAFSPWSGQTCKEGFGESLVQLQKLAGFDEGMGGSCHRIEFTEGDMDDF